MLEGMLGALLGVCWSSAQIDARNERNATQLTLRVRTTHGHPRVLYLSNPVDNRFLVVPEVLI